MNLPTVNPRTGQPWTWYDSNVRHECRCEHCLTSQPGWGWANEDCFPRPKLRATDLDRVVVDASSYPGLALTEMGGKAGPGHSYYFLFEFKGENPSTWPHEGQVEALRRLQNDLSKRLTLVEITALSPHRAEVRIRSPFGDHDRTATVDELREWLARAAGKAAEIEHRLRYGPTQRPDRDSDPIPAEPKVCRVCGQPLDPVLAEDPAGAGKWADEHMMCGTSRW